MADADGFLSQLSLTPIDCSVSAPAALPGSPTRTGSEWRLRKHAEYQRVYKSSRKHSSASMGYFYALRPSAAVSGIVHSKGHASSAEQELEKITGDGVEPLPAVKSRVQQPPIRGPRVGLTAGKVLGNAVVRNRIKRRMREAVRAHVAVLTSDVDVILHPRKFVATMEFAKLEAEVRWVFATVQSALDGQRAK
ncbi:MAG TPA: ribonuclease P protein component [Acidisarcina sp.]